MYAYLLMMIAILSSFAQSTEKTREEKKNDSIIECGYSCLATIYVRVTDKNGKEDTSLRHDNFTVHEDGVIQQIVAMWRNDNYKAECKPARYQISYYPVNEIFDGRYRKIRVSVQTKDGKNLKVQVFPRGYHARLLTTNLKTTPNCRSN
jgi:hypothetical protein